MRYKEDFIKKVLNNTDIVDVIRKFSALEKKGDLYIGDCPFHEDKIKSMIVYKDKQIFHCFDCGRGGNALVFLMEKRGIHMDKAVELLANSAGIKITEADIDKRSNDILKANLYKIYNDAALFYNQKLHSTDGAEAMQYVKDRQISEESIKIFGLGYATGKGKDLYKFLKAKGYTDELMLAAGLIKVSETGPYDVFRNRLMFPIMDEQKRIIAFGGRGITDEVKPKYLNSPKTQIFNKSNTLYGIHDIKGNKANYFILCEGNIDVIALHQAGYKNAVATLGTAFTSTHIPVIAKHTKNLILSFDGDDAGQKAAMRTIKTLDGSGMGIRVLSLSPCKDPDEFLKMFGKDEYRDRLERSSTKIDFQLKYMSKPYDLTNPEQKKEYLEKVVGAIMEQQERLHPSQQSQSRER